MAGSPDYKIYRDKKYVGCCKYPEDAAVMVSVCGGDVRWGHSPAWTLWREGEEKFSAGESYDRAAMEMHARLAHKQQVAHAKCIIQRVSVA